MQPGLSLLRAGEPRFVEMFEQAHVADRVQRHAAGQHQPVGAGGAQQMIDDMDHRILEHQLRRRRLVETILGVRPMVDVLDAQHRVRIPQLIGFQGLAEKFEQRALVRVFERVALPVRHGAIEFYRAIGAEIQHVFQASVIRIGRAVHVAPGRGAHIAALAGQPGPAALGRRDHAVEGAERIEHAVIAGEAAHRAVLGCIQRDRPPVAGAVEHCDGDGLAGIGKWRCRE